MAMLMTKYGQPIDWTVEKLYDANSALTTFAADVDNDAAAGGNIYPPLLDALLDDLNTPQVITELFNLHKMIIRAKDRETQDEQIKMLSASLTLLGLDNLSGFKNGAHVHFEHVVTDDDVKQAIVERNATRKAKDFKESDRIRDELLAQGIVLKDNADGTTTWEVKR